MKAILMTSLMLLSLNAFAGMAKVDVNENLQARQQILKQKFVQEKIELIESYVFGRNHFKFDNDINFVNWDADLPEHLDPESIVAQQIVIMFLGSDYTYLCELRLDLVFSMNEDGSVHLNEENSAYQMHQCYPKI